MTKVDEGLLGLLTSHKQTVQSVPPDATSRVLDLGRKAMDVTNAAWDEFSQCCNLTELFPFHADADGDDAESVFPGMHRFGMESVTLTNPSSSAVPMYIRLLV